jgi:hypothetical protein
LAQINGCPRQNSAYRPALLIFLLQRRPENFKTPCLKAFNIMKKKLVRISDYQEIRVRASEPFLVS